MLSKRTKQFLLVCFVLSSQVAAISLWESMPGESLVNSIGIVLNAIFLWLLSTAFMFVTFGLFLKLLLALGQWIWESFYRFPVRRD